MLIPSQKFKVRDRRDAYLTRNNVVEKRSCGSSSCDAPIAEGVGDASSPESAAKPNRAPVFSRDEGVAFTFCDEASPLPLAATASFRLTAWIRLKFAPLLLLIIFSAFFAAIHRLKLG
jgi:hypothetical protein